MSSNTTNRFMNKNFSRNNFSQGVTARTIKLQERKQENSETSLRNEIQRKIRELVEKRKSGKEIIEILEEKEKYKKYEQYFSTWIENWISNANPKVKVILKKTTSKKNITYEGMKEEIKSEDPELYDIYEQEISNMIKRTLEVRKTTVEEYEKRKQAEERE